MACLASELEEVRDQLSEADVSGPSDLSERSLRGYSMYLVCDQAPEA